MYKLIEGNKTLLVLIGNMDIEKFQLNDCSVMGIEVPEWNNDLTPWYCEKVFKKGSDFAGNGDLFLESVRKDIDEVKQKLCPKYIVMAGYSLAGLFTMYYCTKETGIEACASVSGSLWYPGFLTYLDEHPLNCKHVYLSIGDTEKKTSSVLMRQNESLTNQIYEKIMKYTDGCFIINNGDHFHEVDQRMFKAIKWVLDRIEFYE